MIQANRRENSEDEVFGSFWEHFEELRRTLLRVLFIIGSSTLLCFVNCERILSIITKPLTSTRSLAANEESLTYFRIFNSEPFTKKIDLPKDYQVSQKLSEKIHLENGTYSIFPGGSLIYNKTQPAKKLVLLSPLEGILFSLKTSLWTGIFISSPFWLYVLSRFFIPGLKGKERNLIFPFIAISLVFIVIGCFFAYFMTIPIANEYFINFNQEIGTNLWSLGNYLDYSLFLIMANGIVFEFAAIGIFAVHLQILSAQKLSHNRRFAILGAFILAALLTPPDILTQFFLAIPLIGIYEALVLYARFKDRKPHSI